MKFENLNGGVNCQTKQTKCDAWRQPDAERNQAVFGNMDWRIPYYSSFNCSCLCSLLLLSHGEMSPNCQIEHGRSDSDVGTPCSNRAVATCAECGVAICADCRMWCCGESFCNEQQVFSRKAG